VPVCGACGKAVTLYEEHCPNCGTVNPGYNPDVAAKHHDRIMRERSAREHEQRVSSLPVVTLYEIPGKAIDEIIGLLSAEVVLGTGMWTEFRTGISDFLGTRGTNFEKKIQKAREAAVDELRRRAVERGADAVLGVDMEITTVADVPMILVTGTAVRLEPEAAGS